VGRWGGGEVGRWGGGGEVVGRWAGGGGEVGGRHGRWWGGGREEVGRWPGGGGEVGGRWWGEASPPPDFYPISSPPAARFLSHRRPQALPDLLPGETGSIVERVPPATANVRSRGLINPAAPASGGGGGEDGLHGSPPRHLPTSRASSPLFNYIFRKST
jgi:hypothetical protein